jgi:hypothetical protein
VSPNSSKKIQTGGGKTVKLKVKTVRTIDFNQVKRAEKYGQIVQTRSGGYELVFPTKLNGDLEPYIGKDFDMDVVQEGENLKVILTHDKRAKLKKNLRDCHSRKPNGLEL